MASAVVTIGGKGSSLSSSSVYLISHGVSKVNIDSSALEKLSQQKKPHLISPQKAPANPRFLTPVESRASLTVLLNKLILSDSSIRPALPILIQETLNLGYGHETLDFGSSLGLVDSICRLNGKNLDEIGVTSQEIEVIDNAFAASNGICALLDCCSSVLVKLSDAVAALSCEAARADVAAFDLTVSGDGFSIKEETDVAGDLKVLLFGSKLVGKVDAGAFTDISTLHGSFREAVKRLHSRVRVELNSIIKVKKVSGVVSNGKEKAFTSSVLPIAMSIQSMGEISLGRTGMAIATITDHELQSKVLEIFKKRCPSFDEITEKFHFIAEKAPSGLDCVEVFHSVYDLLVKFREILAWEAAIALFVLDIDESIEKPQVGPPVSIKENGENEKGDKKSDKKKKKTLGKGTSIIRLLLKDRLMSEASGEEVADLVERVKRLSLYFDPKYNGLDSLLSKLKEIVESNEVRRLPKIPKVSDADIITIKVVTFVLVL